MECANCETFEMIAACRRQATGVVPKIPAELVDALRAYTARGRNYCQQASDALRAGAAITLDIAEGGGGSKRSIGIGVKVQDARRMFKVLELGLSDPTTVLDVAIGAMGRLYEFCNAVRDELIVALEQRGVDTTNLRLMADQLAEWFASLPQHRSPAERKLGPPGSSQPADADGPVFSHSPDFTWIIWCRQQFAFSTGNQAESIRCLWEAWEASGRRDGCGLNEKSIGEAAQSSADNFRLAALFRGHPCWGTVIRRCGKGQFSLFRLESPISTTS